MYIKIVDEYGLTNYRVGRHVKYNLYERGKTSTGRAIDPDKIVDVKDSGGNIIKKAIYLQFEDLEEETSVQRDLIFPNSTVYLLDESGKTIDKISC